MTQTAIEILRAICNLEQTSKRLAFMLYAMALSGFANADELDNFGSLDIAQLAQIKVVSVSKKEESLQQAASAVTVVTSEEIRRSGATTLPEALRYIPGLEVAQINAHDWAVTSRGLNNIRANSLLVLVDGRTIYSPTFGGVFWETSGIPMEEIERIEVIRGPGGTTWGANAVNGVINVITKSSKDTQGVMLSAGGGTEKNALSYARYGFQLGKNTWGRIYGNYTLADEARFGNGAGAGGRLATGTGVAFAWIQSFRMRAGSCFRLKPRQPR